MRNRPCPKPQILNRPYLTLWKVASSSTVLKSKLSEPLLYKGFNSGLKLSFTSVVLLASLNALLHQISRPAPRQCTIFVVEPFVKQILTYGM